MVLSNHISEIEIIKHDQDSRLRSELESVIMEEALDGLNFRRLENGLSEIDAHVLESISSGPKHSPCIDVDEAQTVSDHLSDC